jgi:hypothetical protein
VRSSQSSLPGAVIRTVSALAASAALLLAAPAVASGHQQAGQDVTPGTITTIAGGMGGPGPGPELSVDPCAVTFSGGSLYATDLTADEQFFEPPAVVRQISLATGILRTVAGDGTDVLPAFGRFPQPSPDGSPATWADLDASCGVAVDRAGNVLVSDSTPVYRPYDATPGDYMIRVIAASDGQFYGQPMTKGDIYTIVGSPTSRQYWPGAIAVDQAGNVVFVDGRSHIAVLAERTGSFYGQSLTAGRIYTVAGGGSRLGDGGPALKASLSFAYKGEDGGLLEAGLRIDHQGNIVVADLGHNRVRVVAGRSGWYYGRRMRAGHIYTIAGDGIPGATGDGGPATSARIGAVGLAVDHVGNVVISGAARVRVLAARTGRFYGQPMTAGDIYTIAGSDARSPGNGGLALRADVADPLGVSVDGAGNVVVADNASLRVIASKTAAFYGQRMLARHIYSIAGNGEPGYGDDGGPATAAQLTVGGGVQPLAADQSGDVFVTDSLRRGGVVRMTAAASGTLFGQHMTAGHIYRIAGALLNGSTAAAIVADKAAIDPAGISADPAGNLLIADFGHQEVRVVAARSGDFYGQHMTAGHIYTVAGNGRSGQTGDGEPAAAAQVGLPRDVVADPAGNLLITAGCELRVVAAADGMFYGQPMTAGDIYTIAGSGGLDGTCDDTGDGGPASLAELSVPGDLALDANGNVVIGTQTIRVIAARTGSFYGQPMTAGDIYSVGRSAVSPITGAIAADSSGNIVLARYYQESVSVLAGSSGTFYGQAMTAGQVYQIAGDGFSGNTGDGGPATQASLLSPIGVAVAPDGDVLVAGFLSIRRIAE